MSRFYKLVEGVLDKWDKSTSICNQIYNDLVEMGYPSYWVKEKLYKRTLIKSDIANALEIYPDLEVPNKFNSLAEVIDFHKGVIDLLNKNNPNRLGLDRSNEDILEFEKHNRQFDTISQQMDKEIEGKDVDSEGALIENPDEVEKFMQGSVVVDKKGRPLALYIGTEQPVDNQFDFKHKRAGTFSKQNAIFATTRKDIANEYRISYLDGKKIQPANTLNKVYMNLKNPLIVDFKGATFWGVNLNGKYDMDDEDWIKAVDIQGNHITSFAGNSKVPAMNQIVVFAKKNGYDGVIAKNIRDFRRLSDKDSDLPYKSDDYVAFNPKQIMVVNKE